MEKAINPVDKAKTDGLTAAMNCFAKFYDGNIDEQMCNQKLFEDFGAYLLKQTYVVGNVEQTYSCGTMTQYLSGVFNSLKKKFPTLVLWHLDTN